jgi:hypothetical protein
MKRISAAATQKIQDFAVESESGLPAYVLEKDMHVFDALKILSKMPANKHFRLVFCGGTCLSKAYGILERMSEDVDFKVVPTDLAHTLTRSALRNELRAFRKSVAAELRSGGFTGEDAIVENSRDEGAYGSLRIEYESSFEKPESLRAHLLIELNYTELANSTQKNDIGLLIDQLLRVPSPSPLKLECVSLEEALAEKLISFPRRLGKHMADQLAEGNPGPKKFDDELLKEESKWDKSLVRHLYDVNILMERHPELISGGSTFGELLATVIAKDAQDFKNSHADYRDDPAKELQAAMSFALGSGVLRAQYEKFVSDMVYGANVPSYAKAVLHFDSTLKSILLSPALQSNFATKTASQPTTKAKLGLGGPAL